MSPSRSTSVGPVPRRPGNLRASRMSNTRSATWNTSWPGTSGSAPQARRRCTSGATPWGAELCSTMHYAASGAPRSTATWRRARSSCSIRTPAPQRRCGSWRPRSRAACRASASTPASTSRASPLIQGTGASCSTTSP